MEEGDARAPRKTWLLCLLLFAATTLNYLDRQTLSILAPTMQNAALGWLFSVFYYTYTLAQFAVGVNLDRYVSDDGAGGVDAKRVDGGRPAGRFRIAGRR